MINNNATARESIETSLRVYDAPDFATIIGSAIVAIRKADKTATRVQARDIAVEALTQMVAEGSAFASRLPGRFNSKAKHEMTERMRSDPSLRITARA